MVDEEEQKADAPGTPAAAAAKGKGMWIGIVVVVIVIVILLAAVFGGLFGTPGPNPNQVLKIGTVLTLTGTSGLEAFGPKNQRGALLAVEEDRRRVRVTLRPPDALAAKDVEGRSVECLLY